MIDWGRARPGQGMDVVGVLERTRGPLVRVRFPGAALDARLQIGDGGPEGRVVGLDRGSAWVLPLGRLEGLRARAPVTKLDAQPNIPVGPGLLGRVLDGLGRPLDGARALPRGPAPAPLSVLERRPVASGWATGVKVVDSLLPVGLGQRIGVFSGPGAGKSSLLLRLARAPGHDVLVAGLVGERGREVGEFWEALGPRRAQSVVVVATSDDPAMLRLEAAWTASRIAARLRAEGRRVLLLVDSLTRFARATRELGAALGEPPCVRGFPARSFSELAGLVEVGGASDRGAVTAVHTVLEEDEDDPIADEIRSLVDGHIVLDPARAQRGLHPAVDVVRSVSRCMDRLTTKEQRARAATVRSWLALLERDDVRLGLLPPGQDPAVDRARAKADALEAFLRQDAEPVEAAETLAALAELVDA